MSFDALEAARSLEPAIKAAADRADTDRRFPDSVIEGMARARLFRQLAPRVVGGDELDPITALEVCEAISRIDGSAGWLAMVGSGASFLAGYLDAAVGHEIFDEPAALLCGNIGAATARSVPTHGGYRVSGRWPFVSGCTHATWIAGNTLVEGAAQQPRIVVFPREQARIIDTWHATGLRATCSHDVAVDGIFVPEDHTLWWSDGPKDPAPLYAVRFMITTHAAHALGIARAAIDALLRLSEHKRPTRANAPLRDLPQMHVMLAQAEALVATGRAFMWEMTAEAWSALCSGRSVGSRQRALLRLAMTQAVQNAAQAVDLMWAAAGSSPVYTSSPLERCFRDIHVATQHAAVGQFSYAAIGAGLLQEELGGQLI